MRKIFIILVFWTSASQAQTTHIITPSDGGGVGGSSIPSNIVYLSKAGIVSDASLDTGSTTFGTDQTAAIQAILNTSSADNPLTVFVDVKASVTGLKIKSNTTINILPKCGFILRDSSNKWLLVNYNWVAFGNSIVDSNITINGGILNCNGWRGGIGRQNHSDSTIGMTTGLMFWGTKNTRLENVHIMNARTWCIATLTTEKFYMNNCFIDQGASAGYNQDGITNLGYINGFTITNSTITSGDDRIAFCPNSTGGTNGTENHYPYTGVDGDETGIRIDNIVFKGPGKGFAFYIQGGNKISDVYISDISGTAASTWFEINNYLSGYTMTSGSQIAHNFHVSNIDVQVSSYVGYGSNPRPNMLIQGSIDRLDLKNITRTDWSQNAETINISTLTSSPRYVTIRNLTIDGYQSFIPDGASNIASHIILGNATVTNFNLVNSTIDFYGYAYPINRSLLSTSSATIINNLFMSNDRVNNFKNVINNAGTIGYLSAQGIIHTGQDATDATFLNTGTVSNASFSNIHTRQLTSGTFANSDSTNIIYH